MTVKGKKMTYIFPKKIKRGDEIRIISPSSSIDRVGGFDENLLAKKRLENQRFKVTFGKHILETDQFHSSSIQSRVADLHEAFCDKNVAIVMTTIGGLNANELLPYIDWDIIRHNPKVFVGYSDTTSLHNAIRAKTGLVTYYGPSYSSFKMDELQDFQTKEWLRAMTESNYELRASHLWTSDKWFNPNLPRHLMPNKWKIYNHGHTRGVTTGGNIQTYCLQSGTVFFPEIKNPIIFVEQSEGGEALEFSRKLAQILQIHADIKGLIIGRFPTENKMSASDIKFILDKFPILKSIPVVYDIDFGHTQPIFTFPLGGEVSLDVEKKNDVSITVLKG